MGCPVGRQNYPFACFNQDPTDRIWGQIGQFTLRMGSGVSGLVQELGERGLHGMIWGRERECWVHDLRVGRGNGFLDRTFFSASFFLPASDNTDIASTLTHACVYSVNSIDSD